MALGCIHGLGAVVALKGVSMDSCGLRGYPWHGGSCGLKGGIHGQGAVVALGGIHGLGASMARGQLWP